MKVTVLGCGASMGTPSAGLYWGKCDPAEPKNQRSRASILVQSRTTTLLVDTTVDMRMQLNRAGIRDLDAVLFSHAHSDHVNGADDLRGIVYRRNQLMDVYGDADTLSEMDRRWPYLFAPKADGIYVEVLKKNEIEPYQKFRVGDIDIESFEQDHKTCTSLGFRFGKIAYCVDVAQLSDRALDILKGVETWIVDCASYEKETALVHANIQRVKAWTELLKPKMTYLTVLTTHMDYQTLCKELPPHIRPAYDGLIIDTETNER